MGLIRSMSGSVTIKIVSADIIAVLAEVHRADISAENIQLPDEITVTMEILRKDYKRLRKIISSRGVTCSVVHKGGIYWPVKGLLRRPVLLGLLLLLCAGAIWIPGRIFFVRVEGNFRISDTQILAEAERCGIQFGASREEIRSEQVKNALLSSIPQLEWVGINTQGCVAVISVRERADSITPESEHTVGSIRALRDGVIVSCTATEGNLLCRVGQAVAAGEVLISGYTDCGLFIRATRAEGEIFALTQHAICLQKPSEYNSQQQITGVTKKYALIIGKNKINFYKGSGISAGSCDKMYLEYTLMLPGGFSLPVTLVEETWTFFESCPEYEDAAHAAADMEHLAEEYLLSTTVACRILSRNYTPAQTDSEYVLVAQYACCESIGQLYNEEIITNHG